MRIYYGKASGMGNAPARPPQPFPGKAANPAATRLGTPAPAQGQGRGNGQPEARGRHQQYT
ncbi:hypothetical protein AZSI13_25460 [Azospira sp. I13]|nr:hypothetical protein AZSI13_25460 [Azospira sp. I13]